MPAQGFEDYLYCVLLVPVWHTALCLIDLHSARAHALFRDLTVSRISAFVGLCAELIACGLIAGRLLGTGTVTANLILVFLLFNAASFGWAIQTADAGDNVNFSNLIAAVRMWIMCISLLT